MNPNAILALISELYIQVATLTEANTELRNRLAEGPEPTPGPSS